MPDCPLCRSKDVPLGPAQEPFTFVHTCKVCGKFKMTEDAGTFDIPKLSDFERSLLSGLARERSDIAHKNPKKKSLLVIGSGDIESLLDLAPRRVSEKAMKLLAAIERRTSYFGQPIQLENSTDYSLAYAQNTNEFKAFRGYLCERGFLDFIRTSTMHGGGTVTLLADGYAELEKRQQSNLDSHKAFVAMSFDEEFTPLWKNHIEPGIEVAGYAPKRIDFKEHNNDIVAEILAEIRQSRFVVCDFTGQIKGVYFEAGFAKGLSLEIIWMVCKDDLENCHFNTEHFNHITWEPNDDDLKERITNRIIATIGQGPLKPK